MNIFQDIKSVMNDIQQRKAAINNQLQEFQSLQSEIRTLVQQSKTDKSAQDKLLKLQSAFPEGFGKQQEKVLGKVAELGQNFKKLEQEFVNISDKKTPKKVIENTESDLKANETDSPKAKKKKVRSYL